MHTATPKYPPPPGLQPHLMASLQSSMCLRAVPLPCYSAPDLLPCPACCFGAVLCAKPPPPPHTHTTHRAPTAAPTYEPTTADGQKPQFHLHKPPTPLYSLSPT
jgi:hypothetical protein